MQHLDAALFHAGDELIVVALRQRGKQTRTVIGPEHPISNNLFTIPAADEIELVNTLPKGYDLYVTVDCGSNDRSPP